MSTKRFRKNDQIRIPEVFLVDDQGEKIGKIPTQRALSMAREKDLDLVEVAPNAQPPVCRIMDFGSFLFEQKKKEKAQKKTQKAAEMKGVRFGIRISEHDLGVKVKAAKKFLEKNHPIKATLQFKGREIVHGELGFEKMKEFAAALEDVGQIDQPPKKQGRQIGMTLIPLRGGAKKKKEDDE